MKKLLVSFLALSLLFTSSPQVLAERTESSEWGISGSSAYIFNDDVTEICLSDKLTCSTVGGGGGGAPTNATYITQTANGTLTNEQALGTLATGLLKNTTTSGILSIATAGVDYIVSLTTALLTSLTADSTPTGDDIVWSVNDPLGTAANRKVTLANLGKGLDSGVIPNTPAGSIAAANVQAAINELDTEKLGISGSAQSLTLDRIGASTYSTVQEMQNLFHSTGWITGGTINNAGGGNITTDAGTGFIRTTNSATGQIKFFDFAGLASTAIPSDTTRYVGVEYNAGSPQIVVRTTRNWNNKTDFPLGSVVNEGGTLHVMNSPFAVGDHAAQMLSRTQQVDGIERDNDLGGLILGETGTRNVTTSAGALWYRLNRNAISAIDTSVAGTFDSYTGATLDTAANTQWDNNNYNNGGVKTVLTAARYANLWFYVETDGNLVMVYGTAQYTSLALAQAENAPSTVPSRLSNDGILIGQLSFQKGAATATIRSAFTTTFNASVITDHGSLGGLTDDDHSQYALLAGRSGGQTLIGSTLTAENLTLRANAADLTTGQVNVANSLDASSTSVASLTTAGGLGVAKKSFFGDAVFIAQSSPTLGNIFEIGQNTAGIGTISVTAAGNTATGTSTAFLSTFSIGDQITVNGETHYVQQVASNTSLTIADTWTNTFSGVYTLAGGTKFKIGINGAIAMGSNTVGANNKYNFSTLYGDFGGSSQAITNINSSPFVALTIADFSGSLRGIVSSPVILGTNTKNWTNASALVGFRNQPTIQSGATGTIAGAIAQSAAVVNSSATATVTNGIGYYISSVSGVMTNAAGIVFANITNATNNSQIVLGQTTIPTGNWGIYNANTYDNYFAGSLGIGQTTFGTSAAKVLAIGNGTAPSTSPADAFQMWSADRGATAGKAGLHLRSEDGTSYVFSDRAGLLTTTPDYDIGIDGQSARTLGLNRNTTSNTAGNYFTVTAGGATSGATDKDGGRMMIAPGISTGTGMGSVRLQRNQRAASTATSDNAQTDALIVSPRTHITDGVATSLFEIALPTLASTGGVILFSIRATDGTDMQVHTGTVTFAAVNKGGVYTTQITDLPTTADADADSAGTLADTWTILNGTNKVTIQLNANTSLTPTELSVQYVIQNHSPQATTIL